jgi:hypothetical protein
MLHRRVVLAGDRVSTGCGVITAGHTTVYDPFQYDVERFTG